MSDLEQQFNAAVDKVRNAPTDGDFKPSNNYKLTMYALYRQATDGDVSGKRPGMLNVIERAKYDAWAKRKGMTRDQAMRSYVDEVDMVEAQYG
ncbi:acyl-CoA-binding protein [Spectribacter hydrogenooxidans]|uniref:Acyl-CoA-binding protein n=1 Tax=Spectribacter hydrogenoxidans TaxID=3075608 RepID=A0ABU3BYV9_9GAMM|nr:acyl-CoA-binding protein [Salinisphaera sp. W335]MDT0634494.1 acyl-CoA-binding protein [Salinisphaera sp. W335]